MNTKQNARAVAKLVTERQKLTAKLSKVDVAIAALDLQHLTKLVAASTSTALRQGFVRVVAEALIEDLANDDEGARLEHE